MENVKEIAINKQPFDPKKILFVFTMLFALLLITINVHAISPNWISVDEAEKQGYKISNKEVTYVDIQKTTDKDGKEIENVKCYNKYGQFAACRFKNHDEYNPDQHFPVFSEHGNTQGIYESTKGLTSIATNIINFCIHNSICLILITASIFAICIDLFSKSKGSVRV